MENFSQIGGILQSANDANTQAQEQMDRIQNEKEKKAQEAQESKDAFAQAGELLGGGLIEKSAENLIKKGVRLGRKRMKALGVDADEVERMANDYKKNGSSGLIAGVVKRGGLKTKAQLNEFINKMKGKMEGTPAVASSKLLTDDFGLPVTKADLPPDAPLVSNTLSKTGDEFRAGRISDPDFSTSKFRAKVDPSTGAVNIVNNETGNVASDSEIRGYDDNLISKLKKVSGYTEPADPLESASAGTVKAISQKFDSYFQDGNEGAKPLSSDAFDFKAPKPAKPSLPKVSDDISRFGVGDAQNLPSQFKKADYTSDLKGVSDYGKQISKAFLGGKKDEIRGQQLKQRLIDLKQRKANLDSESMRGIYKDKIDGKAPRVKNVNGSPDLDSLEKNLDYRENAMNETEKFQGIARQSESSVKSGFAKSSQQLFDEQFPPVYQAGKEVSSSEPNNKPTQESANEPKPVNNDSEIKSLNDFSSPNVGSTSGTFSNPSIDKPDVTPDFKPPSVSNEIPTGGLGEGEGVFSKIDTPGFGDVLGAVQTIQTLAGSGTTQQKIEGLGEQAAISKGQDIVTQTISDAGKKALSSGTKTAAEQGGQALAKAGATAGETDVALGGPEDPVGDVISAVVGIGTLIGSLVGAKPKPPPKPAPPPPELRATVQIGQDI